MSLIHKSGTFGFKFINISCVVMSYKQTDMEFVKVSATCTNSTSLDACKGTTRVNDTFVVSCVNNTVSRGFDINPFRGQKGVLLKQQFQTLSFEQINERRCQIFWSCTILNPKFILYTFIYIYILVSIIISINLIQQFL